MRGSNVAILLEDEQGLFIRNGTGKFRPSKPVEGLRKGQTIKAWPWSGGLKVEHAGASTIWDKE